MSGVSGVGSSGSIPPQEPVQQVTDPNEDTAISFFHNQYKSQVAAIGKEENL